MRGLTIRTRGLVHIYHAEGHDVAALSGVDLDVAAGEMVGLLGPSGSGKSTLMSLLAGIFRPSAGKVFVGETELSTAPPRALDRLRATDVGLVLQGASRNLLPHATPADNVRFAQQQARRAGRSLPDPAEVLAELGLVDHADEPLTRLTPGGLQLTAVAAAVSTRPGLLLCDEPTSQLDHAARDRVLDALAHVSTTFGTTVVLVTHDPDVARVLPRTVTIRDGRIGGEGRSGDEYAVVTADGFLPLLGHVRDRLPPGTLVRIDEVGDHFEITAQLDEEER
jgi:ABC-type lipoprotein export system ATPase subunit